MPTQILPLVTQSQPSPRNPKRKQAAETFQRDASHRTSFNPTAVHSSESLSSAAAGFCLMSSPACVDVDALTYEQRLQAVLHGHHLPHVINLGSSNFVAGKYVATKGFFKPMTAVEVQQLANRLQSQPHVTHLNLVRQQFGPEGMRVLAGPISMQTYLQTLIMYST
jgi:hypothetical protein